MPTFADYQYWYKVTSGLPGGTLTLGSGVTRGGGAPHRVSDIADGNPDGMTGIDELAADGRAGDPDQGTMTFQGFTANGEPIFFFAHSNSFFNGFRVYSDTPYDFGTTVGSTASGVYHYCFAAGTLIATPDGECPVEQLAINDPLRTATGDTVAVKWIGRQRISPLFEGPKSYPVRISANALAAGIPHRDLTVTADHGIFIDGFLINASALVNASTIRFVAAAELPAAMVFYHIETPGHETILANGTPAETFIDVADRKSFDNYAEYLDLYRHERIIPEMPHPRISSQRLVPGVIRSRLGISTAAGADLFAQS